MKKNDLFDAYYGEDSDYYTGNMTKYENGQKFSFNFWAGFFGCFWFFYRKMYLAGVITLFCSALEWIATYYYILSFDPPLSDLYFHLFQVFNYALCFIIISFLANTIYIAKSIRVVKKVLLEHKPEEPDSKDLALLSMKGGISLGSVLYPLIIIFAAIVGICAFLFSNHVYF